MNREIQLLNELREYLVDNTSDTRFVWFSGEEDVQFWESEGGPIFRALFRGGPRRALLGIRRNRYFNREHEFINIYIRPVFELGVGYRENHARQLFEVCTGNTPDSEQKFEGVGFEGVARILSTQFYDEYDVVNDRLRNHRGRVDDFERGLRN
jgi:hypothetical protein